MIVSYLPRGGGSVTARATLVRARKDWVCDRCGTKITASSDYWNVNAFLRRQLCFRCGQESGER